MALASLGQSFSTPTDCSKIMSRLERWVSTLLFFRGDRWLSDFTTSILKGWCLFLKVYPKGNKHILSRPLRRGLEKSKPYRHHTLTGKYLSQVQTFFTTFFCATLALAHKTVPVVHQMTSTASEFDKCFCCARLESSVFCHSAIESKGGVGRAILPTFVLQHIQEIYVYIILYIYRFLTIPPRYLKSLESSHHFSNAITEIPWVVLFLFAWGCKMRSILVTETNCFARSWPSTYSTWPHFHRIPMLRGDHTKRQSGQNGGCFS